MTLRFWIWKIESYFRVKYALWKFQKYMNKRVKEMRNENINKRMPIL